MVCPTCGGAKKLQTLFPIVSDGDEPRLKTTWPTIPCPRCGGTGEADNQTVNWMVNGEILKKSRFNKNLNLRNASKILNIDVHTLSQMEQGIIKPDLTLASKY